MRIGVPGKPALFVLTFLVLLTGCQSNDSISLEKAVEVSRDNQDLAFIAPPRTTDDLREWIVFPPAETPLRACVAPTPNSAEEIIETIGNSCKLSNDRGTWGPSWCQYTSLIEQATYLLDIGLPQQSVELADATIGLWPANRPVYNGITYYSAAFIAAEAGELDLAESYFTKGSFFGSGTDRKTPVEEYFRRELLQRAADGSIAAMQGTFLPIDSENKLIASLGPPGRDSFFGQTRGYIQNVAVKSLLRRYRFFEAEAAVRKAISLIYRKREGRTKPLAGRARGDAMSLLAEVLLAQGKFEDARDFAELSRYTYVSGLDGAPTCTSTRYNNILGVLARSHVAQGDWQKAADVYQEITANYGETHTVYLNRFAGDPSRLWAEIQAGNLDGAEETLAHAMGWSDADLLRNDTTRNELEALAAITALKRGRIEQGLQELARIVPEMMPTLSDGSASTILRRKQIVNTFIDALLDKKQAARSGFSEQEIHEQLFQFSDLEQSDTVQRAIVLAAARNGFGQDDGLVRQVQDLTFQMEALSNAKAQAEIRGDTASSQDLGRKITSLSPALAKLQAELDVLNPEYGNLTKPVPLTVTEALETLTPEKTLVSFSVREQNTLVWAISRSTGLSFADVPVGRRELTHLVKKVRRSISPDTLRTIDDIPEFDLESAHRIYELVFKPVEDAWGNASELIIEPGNVLGQIPLEVLPTRLAALDPAGDLPFSEYRTVPWLIRDHAVTIIPSVGSLRFTSEPVADVPGTQQAFAGFGDPYFSKKQAREAEEQDAVSPAVVRGGLNQFRARPDFRGLGSVILSMFPRLDDTRDELLNVANSLGVDPGQSVFVGRAANEGKVKELALDNYRVLSFATHGVTAGEIDGLDEPALALTNPAVTGDENQDGLLTMGEIMQLKIDADLVVLSACNTATSDGRGTEAVSGLGRAFLYAGARSVLVSHWAVHSAATTDQMSLLFKASAGQAAPNVSQSLQTAKLSQIDEGVLKRNGRAVFSYAHPLFWAPFSLVGDGGKADPAIN